MGGEVAWRGGSAPQEWPLHRLNTLPPYCDPGQYNAKKPSLETSGWCVHSMNRCY